MLLGLLALVLTCVPTVARADSTYGSVSGVSGVLYDDCRPYPYGYVVQNVPADAQSWGLDVSLFAPDGSKAGSDFVGDVTGPGTSAFTLCTQVNPYGTYTIRAVFQWQDSSKSWHFSQLDAAHFTMRKPHTRTTLSASTRRPAYGQVVAWRVRSYDEQPTGYGRNAFAWVHLEKRVRGHWARIKGARAMTHATGAVRIKLHYRAHHQRMLVRAVTEPTSRYARSTSPTLRLW
ncbi:MAG TPA: hypothetical protein VHO29_09740 [Marmoricola sp.]|nr:hypothetical protein [Marmoricola sp.]